MERKIAKLLALTGVVIGAAASLTPLTSYAADGIPCADNPANVCATDAPKAITLNVDSKISLDTAEGTGVIHVSPNTLSTGKISATVSSTQAYNILLSATQPNLVKSDDASQMIAAGSNFRAGDKAWGIKKTGAADYTGLTTVDTVFYTSTSAAASQKTELEVGVSVPYGTPTGSYKTEVTVTAAAST